MSNVRIALPSVKPPDREPPPAYLDLLDHMLDDARDIPWACALLDVLTPEDPRERART